MSFNIYQLDELDHFDENALWEYRDSLVRLFVQSPDGQAYSGFWADSLVYYGYAYVGVTLPHMTAEQVGQVISGLFPAHIPLAAPEDADYAIPELLAFWHYLKWEYNLQQADEISILLGDIAPKFRDIMTPPPPPAVPAPVPTAGAASVGALAEEYDDEGDDLPGDWIFTSAGGKRSQEENARMKKKRKAAKAARKKGRKH